jgi:hypothetical protein
MQRGCPPAANRSVISSNRLQMQHMARRGLFGFGPILEIGRLDLEPQTCGNHDWAAYRGKERSRIADGRLSGFPLDFTGRRKQTPGEGVAQSGFIGPTNSFDGRISVQNSPASSRSL